MFRAKMLANRRRHVLVLLDALLQVPAFAGLKCSFKSIRIFPFPIFYLECHLLLHCYFLYLISNFTDFFIAIYFFNYITCFQCLL